MGGREAGVLRLHGGEIVLVRIGCAARVLVRRHQSEVRRVLADPNREGLRADVVRAGRNLLLDHNPFTILTRMWVNDGHERAWREAVGRVRVGSRSDGHVMLFCGALGRDADTVSTAQFCHNRVVVADRSLVAIVNPKLRELSD